MITVYQVFCESGYPFNNQMTDWVGRHVSKRYEGSRKIMARKKIIQKEGNKEYVVWSYPEYWRGLILGYIEECVRGIRTNTITLFNPIKHEQVSLHDSGCDY